MFPPGATQGGNDPRLKRVMTAMNRPNPGGLAQGAPPQQSPPMPMGGAPGQPGAMPGANGGVPQGSVSDLLAMAVDAIAAARNDPATIEALNGFMIALEQMAGAGQMSPAAPEESSPPMPGNTPGMVGQGAPSPRGPRR